MFFLIKENSNVNTILNIINTGYLSFSQEEIVTLTNFFLRFGSNMDIALKNGEIYDNDNFLLVKVIINKIDHFISLFNDRISTCRTFEDYSISLYDYLEELNLQDLFLSNIKNF